VNPSLGCGEQLLWRPPLQGRRERERERERERSPKELLSKYGSASHE
jgi:hypothetical protein